MGTTINLEKQVKLKTMVSHSEYPFIESLKSVAGVSGDVSHIVHWLKEQNEKIKVHIERINFNDMQGWCFDTQKSIIHHHSGRFFSIEGIRVNTNWAGIGEWDQPIINQPEIGYLGFIVKKIDGVLHFLTQAKIEPGNVNKVQLSPTIQATRSNCMRIHKGKRPHYLEYFENCPAKMVLYDQLQSEQGSRFLQKRNRNMIIQVDDDIPLLNNFVWLTLGQLKQLICYDNVINMDTRSVLSSITCSFFQSYSINAQSQGLIMDSALFANDGVHSLDEILHVITDLKCRHELQVDKIPLYSVRDWHIKPDEISRLDDKEFKVIAVDVSISNREVVNWQQPMIQPTQQGLFAFICKKMNGVIHYAVQLKLECGLRDIIEMAPTVQCHLDDTNAQNNLEIAFLNYVLSAPLHQIIIDVMQSEEGGRFYHEQNRNIVVMADEQFSNTLPENYIWLTLNQLHFFVQFNNFLNIQARSLLAAIPSFDI